MEKFSRTFVVGERWCEKTKDGSLIKCMVIARWFDSIKGCDIVVINYIDNDRSYYEMWELENVRGKYFLLSMN